MQGGGRRGRASRLTALVIMVVRTGRRAYEALKPRTMNETMASSTRATMACRSGCVVEKIFVSMALAIEYPRYFNPGTENHGMGWIEVAETL